MNLPFTAEQFFQVFSDYNRAVGIAPVLLMVPALLSGLALRRRRLEARRMVAYSLAGLWLWSGVVYHLLFFTRVNPLAWAFGALFVAQGVWFYRWGARDGATRGGGGPSRVEAAMGATMILYAVVGYPVVSILLGHSWPAVPTFGVPCPVVIFTLGAWVWLGLPGAKRLLIVPLAWSGLGSTVALEFGVWEDVGLLVAGAMILGLLGVRWTKHLAANGEPRGVRPAPFNVRPAR